MKKKKEHKHVIVTPVNVYRKKYTCVCGFKTKVPNKFKSHIGISLNKPILIKMEKEKNG